ncbi:vitamin K-dependent gamma-carboxylase-like protein [Prosthecobacter fusiformis]|uniref:Vitamin K-dependent gamma-carboxylase-like protein n=2 Tax=Prosthecobacter fusiformis TaxID=48464 RepID=A0A4R7RYH5_9BACT|nr:vitamin K-dependent gamma-carboxylase-like protein [Prosthecobacter fusiformis]
MDEISPSAQGTSVPSSSPWSQRLHAFLFSPVHIAWLVIFRIAFGGIMLWEVWRYFAMDRIRRYYIEPHFHFTYYGFEWVKPWEGDGMYHHFYALGALSICILFGLYYRLATTLFFLGFTYVFLLDQTQHLNHFYLVSLISFLLIFVPAHRAFSLDAWRMPKLHTTTVPGWSLWLLRAQIGLVYFFGGIAKMGPDWLAGEPMRSWLAARMDFPVIGPYFQDERVVAGFVYGGLLLDLLVVPALLWKRTRIWAFLAAVAFHLLNARLFSIGIFPWFMLCATLIFFPADLPRRIWQSVLGKKSPASSPLLSMTTSPWTRSQHVTAVLLAAYFLVQILMPLRHWLYPGNVDWTEEGHRFSWHMKLRSKDAQATFLVTDLRNGHITEVYPGEYLTERQCGKMANRPDMILQFAHYLAEQLKRQDYEKVEVRAHIMASLNGRKPQLLVDPTVDLSREPRNLAPARWIMPLTEPLKRQPSMAILPHDTETKD